MDVPATMATQHPDSASRYVPIQEEPDEAVHALTPQPEGLGIEELMIDFEGKMTPYHQTADIAHKLVARGLVPGEDVFITPRISSATEETAFRQLMALMSIIEADYDLMKTAGKGFIKEVILPMVRGPDDLLALRRRISDVIDLAHKEFGFEQNYNALQVIPLVEDVPRMVEFRRLFREFVSGCREAGLSVDRVRFLIGRSDSSLSYGLVAAALGAKIMISEAYRAGAELGLEVAPIYGGGSLPFRGHVTAENFGNLLKDYAGIRTITIQSGIRYDQGFAYCRRLVTTAREQLPKSEPRMLAREEMLWLSNLVALFGKHYLRAVQPFSRLIGRLSDVIPQQRDRLTRRGPTGYARPTTKPASLAGLSTDARLRDELEAMPEDGFQFVPRAISYTGALYSAGLPPEFLGLGPALRELLERSGERATAELLHYYPGLRSDLSTAARFAHLRVAASFFPQKTIENIDRDMMFLEDQLQIPLLAVAERPYQTLLEIIEPLVRQVMEREPLGEEDRTLLRSCMVRLGKMRGSLG